LRDGVADENGVDVAPFQIVNGMIGEDTMCDECKDLPGTLLLD
jgi:hypothetical protein